MATRKQKRVVSINDYELPRKRTRSQRMQNLLGESDTPHDDKVTVDDGPNPEDSVPASKLASGLSPAHDLESDVPSLERDAKSVSKKASKTVSEKTPSKPVRSKKALEKIPDVMEADLPRPSSGTLSKTKTKTKTKTTSKKERSITTGEHLESPLSTAPMSSSGLSLMDKDVMARQKAFMQKEQRLARKGEAADFLLQPPALGFTYITKKGEFGINDDRFGFSRPVRDHPKIQEAEKNGTLTREKEIWYRGMPHKVTIPTAGIPSDKFYTAFNDDSEDAFHARPSIKLFVPDILKAMLVDDWENITKNNQLVPLPHPHPVTKILEDYAAYETPKRPAGSSHVDILEETLAGLKEYFDKSLGRILLYRFERAQYAEMYKKWMSDDPEYQGKTASDTYGPEHLMRLIVSLPELVAQTNMDQQSVNRLREELVKFCTWLSKNTTEYFVSHYESPPQDYIQKAKD
ncbi:MRG-domain-containing protein [Daldinia eschscholtzii]|nr:MRG-domain-containing protein [Daldinia eschscholtzii]